jgi:hypothetical protein
MSKFKVGDKVICVRPVNSCMEHFTNKMGTISKLCPEGYLYFEESLWSFGRYTPEQFDLVEVTKNETTLASRHNNGKIRPTLFPVVVYKEVLKVFQFGAEKYGDYNWQKGFKYLDCADSLERHLLEWKEGKDKDEESKLYHLAHIIANAAFLLFYTITGNYSHLDNRNKTELNSKENSNGKE